MTVDEISRVRRAAERARRRWEERRRLPWELRYVHAARLASQLRRAAILATHRHCTVEIPGSVHVGPSTSVYIPHQGTLRIGADTELRRGFHCEVWGAGRVEIGAGCVFTSYALIQCSTVIEIGEGTGIGQACIVVDGKHRYRDWRSSWRDQGFDLHPVRIGRWVQVLSKATILADVGDGSVIGANAVVVDPIPAYCLAVGVPARVVDYFGPPELRPQGIDV